MAPNEDISTEVEASEEPELDDRIQQIATLAILGVVGIAFLALCLPWFIL